jgi:glycosyltransferase involved in cell wall biosynthesis
LPDVPTAVVPAVVPEPEPASHAGEDKEQLRASLGLPDDEVIVGFIGRLVEEKGIRDLLDALDLLGAQAPFLTVWGAGPLEPLVLKWLRDPSHRGNFGGALDLGDVSRALESCDLLAVPSKSTRDWTEQFGRILVEAMWANCPLLAYRSGAIPEVVGDAGELVPEGDIVALSDGLSGLSSDESRRRTLAARGRVRVRDHYHPDVLAEKLVRLWSGVLNRSGPVPRGGEQGIDR